MLGSIYARKLNQFHVHTELFLYLAQMHCHKSSEGELSLLKLT